MSRDVSQTERERNWRTTVLAVCGIAGVLAVVAVIIAVVSVAQADKLHSEPARASDEDTGAQHAAHVQVETATTGRAPTLDEARGVDYEPFERVDPNLPDPPAGDVKKFEVDVFHHVTQVDKNLAPTEVWSFAVNGRYQRGTGVSPPMVVTEGDLVDFTLINGSSEKMNVTLPHSMDFHSAEVDPGRRYADVEPGEKKRFRFRANHPGVFMYHCATEPVLMHTGAGMVGAFIVKPRDLPKVDRELWITQQEFYLGAPGMAANQKKMEAKNPDVIAFNGYAHQYMDHPITVRRGETIRMYVMNAGPSIWSAFHVIGTVFDRVSTDNGRAEHVQTVNLAPSQGGWVEFTLDEEGTYPFVTHSFADTAKGAVGVLVTENKPEGTGHRH